MKTNGDEISKGKTLVTSDRCEGMGRKGNVTDSEILLFDM